MAIRRERRLQEREIKKSKKYVDGFIEAVKELDRIGMEDEDKNNHLRHWYLLLSLEFSKYKTISLEPRWLHDTIKDGKSKRVLIKSLI